MTCKASPPSCEVEANEQTNQSLKGQLMDSSGTQQPNAPVRLDEWQLSGLPLHWFQGVRNVGDLASPLVCQRLLGVPVRPADRSQPHLLGVGSILASANQHSLVWGTGMMHPEFGAGGLVTSNVLALRGKLSASLVMRTIGPLGDIALGDPALLLASPPMAESIKPAQYALGLVPHYTDREHPLVHLAREDPDILVLDVGESPDLFLESMATCRTVASTSLHGLVFACALGIPYVWIQLSNGVKGEGFKFHDFFSTIINPQVAPLAPTSTGRFLDLSSACEIRPYSGDLRELASSLTNHLSNREVQTDAKIVRSFHGPKSKESRIPAIVISYNRGEFLQQCCASLLELESSLEIVIHDNGSDDPETLEVLNGLEQSGIVVNRRGKIKSAGELDKVDETVQRALGRHSGRGKRPEFYIVTDCDIDVSPMVSGALDVFQEILRENLQLEVVGPMLRIWDIPQGYPLRTEAVKRHVEQFWRYQPERMLVSSGPVFVRKCAIDTTFALHRSTDPFRRLKRGLRVYAPFEALHLDWYLSREELASREYGGEGNGVAHWSRHDLASSRGWTKPEPISFWDVDYVSDRQSIEIVERTLLLATKRLD